MLSWDYVSELFPDGMIADMFDAYCSAVDVYKRQAEGVMPCSRAFSLTADHSGSATVRHRRSNLPSPTVEGSAARGSCGAGGSSGKRERQ